MKCEKCGNAQAVFHYQSIINGNSAEYHLCRECARQEGFTEALNWRPESILGNMAGEPFGFGFERAFPEFMSAMTEYEPMPRFVWGFPAIMIPARQALRTEAETGCPEAAEGKIPADAGSEMRAKRELIELKNQMQAAIQAQDFERAAEIRDEIRKKEASGKE